MYARATDPHQLLRALNYPAPLIREARVEGLDEAVLVGHSNMPLVARTACVAIVASPPEDQRPQVAGLVGDALAAPVVLMSNSAGVEWWCPSKEEDSGARFIDAVTGGVDEIRKAWGAQLDPVSVQRARTPGRHTGGYQMPLFDSMDVWPALPVDRGLLSRHEEAQAARLADFIDRVLSYISASTPLETPEVQYQAITLAFWIVASRILRDAGVESFRGIDYSNPDDVINRVQVHYGAALPLYARHREWREGLSRACDFARTFWGLSAAAIGPEVLGRVNEQVRISDAQRATLGAHSTPTFLVDYIVGGLAPHIWQIPRERRVVAEPTCGHGGFLVAALRLLACDIPPDISRHDYLRSMVRGQDRDAVSAEIARLSLTLADIPNPDGWSIEGGKDIFLCSRIERLVEGATVVLANPPFEDFTLDERDVMAKNGVYPVLASRGAEIFRRCLEAAQPGTLIGFVLPPGLLDSPSSVDVALRRRLLQRADILEITELPDGVFHEAETGSFALLARIRDERDPPASHWPFRSVSARHLAEFRVTGEPTQEVLVRRSDVQASPRCPLRVPPHADVWSRRAWFRLRSVSGEFGQGMSINAKAPKQEKDKPTGRRGEGVESRKASLGEGLPVQHLLLGKGARSTPINSVPPLAVTLQRPGAQPLERHGAPTGRPRVVMNRARRSREGWWIQAFIDPSGRRVAQDGFVVEPGAYPWDSPSLWAVLNSPFANVYVRAQATENSISPVVIGDLPLPALSKEAAELLHDAARDCLAAHPSRLSDYMIRLDAIVHGLYGLPAEDEWAIIADLEGKFRPGVGPYCGFEDFDRRIPLYLQLRIPLPLPEDPQISPRWDSEALFRPQEAIYAEVAALDQLLSSDEVLVKARRAWLVSWRHALQRREIELIPPTRLPSDSFAADIERLRSLRADSGT